ncbi:MAG: cytochrome c biogenesis CcdA family protein, partial [Candidatus Limnocylindrus sp.]
MESVYALTALLAGLLSFLSPCVLPIVPAYLGRLAALSTGTTRTRHALLFTIGFSVIFITLGVSAGYVGGASGRLLPILQIPVG